MVMDSPNRIVLLLFVTIAFMFLGASAGPNNIGVCIRNCAQCKKMFGPYFVGDRCADLCVKYKGKFIPDCEDADSIAPFIIKLVED